MYLFSVIIPQGIFQLLIYSTSCNIDEKAFVMIVFTTFENILALP